MASGGVILAVIPEMHSTKDSVAKPSTLDEVQAEFDAGIWKPNEGHYERWLHYRGMDRSPREMMEQNISIHVHFWEKSNLKALLDKAVRDHGFSSYEITHADNHKDFYFCLRK